MSKIINALASKFATGFAFGLLAMALFNSRKAKVDLPQGWQNISSDSTNPNLLTCYKKDNTIYIQYLPYGKH